MVEKEDYFKIKWLGATEKQVIEFSADSKKVLEFFNSIKWVDNCTEYWKAHSGSSDYFYNEDWSFHIKSENEEKKLEIFVEYHDGIENTNIEKIRFVIIYYWSENVVSKMKSIDKDSHLSNATYSKLKEIVEAFLELNFQTVRNKVNLHYDYFSDDYGSL